MNRTENQLLNQNYVQGLLRESYAKTRLRNPAYSIRAFSKKLGVNHSALSEIMNGKRQVGAKLGERLADALMLKPEERGQIFSAGASSNEAKAAEYRQLEADQYNAIAEWYHFALLSLVETEGFKSKIGWIASRLRISKTDAEAALERMRRLGLVVVEEAQIKLSGKNFSSPDGIANSALRATHHQYLEMAQESLQRDALDERDFVGITMAIDPAKLPEAKKRIRKFRDELCAYLESDEKKEVYQLCLQLFPLSKEVEK